MDLVIHTFRISGISPLLTHNPAAMLAPKSGGARKKEIPTPEDEAASGAYEHPSGFGLPSFAFRGCILVACKGKKIGKVGAATVISGAVDVVDDMCLLEDPETGSPLTDYVIDRRRVMVQRNGVIRSRPKFDPWGCCLRLQLDLDYTEPQVVLDLLNDGGIKCGVGDFRPDKKGPFGKFQAEIED